MKPVAREGVLEALTRVAPRAGEWPTILAIDDDPMALNLIAAVLGPLGYRIQTRRAARRACPRAGSGRRW